MYRQIRTISLDFHFHANNQTILCENKRFQNCLQQGFTFTFLHELQFLASGHYQGDVTSLGKSPHQEHAPVAENKPPAQKFKASPPLLLQPPPGSTCQDILLLSAPLLACRMAKGGGTSILVPFNPLPTSCIAFSPHAHLPSHSFCS